MNDSVALREVIGDGVRRLRESAGKTQDDVARAARSLGMAWPQSKIAALERGEKSVSLEEFFLLPVILQVALDRLVPYGELFADNPSAQVELSPRARAQAHDLAAIFDGSYVPDVAIELDLDKFADSWGVFADRLRQLGSNPTARELSAALEAAGLAEERAARKLGESKAVVAALALQLWGRGLSAERDARVGRSLAPDAPTATVQAKRGRVTRELTEEIRRYIAEREGRG